jgi:hypothetical protein
MAENKKSFVAYAEWLESFEMLEDEEAGKLIKHLLRYVNDLKPELDDRLLKIAFQPIKQQLKRDLNKYEEVSKKRAEAGKKGGLKTQAKAKKAIAKSVKQNQPNQADNDNDNEDDNEDDNVNVNDNDNDNGISSPNGEGVYYNIDRLKNEYLKNQKLCKSVVENQKLKSLHQLSELLTDFNKHLDQLGTASKTWQDYTSHFLNWMKKRSNNAYSPGAVSSTAPERF